MANVFSWDSRIKALCRFESGALTVDSIGSNTLTNVNVAEDTVNYMEGACSALFDHSSNTYLSVLDANLDSGFPCKSGETNRSFTICTRIKPTLPSSDWYFINKSTGSPTGNYHCFRTILKSADKKIGLGLCRDGTITMDHLYHPTPLDPNGSNEYFIALSHDASDGAVRIRILNNSTGVEIGSDYTGTFGYTLNVSDATFFVGALGASGYGFDGNIDEVVVCNGVLTVIEIDAIWAGTYANPTPTKTIVLYDNLITSSSMITALSEATNYEKANLIDKAYSTCWRSTGVSSESLLINFGEAKSVNTLAIGNHNLLAEVTTLDLKFGSTDSCADGTIDLLDDMQENDFIKFSQAISYQYWELVIDGATNISYYQIGELWLGVKVELNKNPLPLIDPFSKKYVAHERGSYAYGLYGFIGWPLEWGNYNNANNHDILLALWNTVKKSHPFWIMLDADNNDTLQYVTIKEFRFDQNLGVGYPGRILVETSN